jgi:DNA-binding XRE family transcriptional regulator
MRPCELTLSEQHNVRAMVLRLRGQYSSWKALAAALGVNRVTLVRAQPGKQAPTVGLALRVARLVGATVDSVLSEWIETVPIREVFEGELVWEGDVQVFAVEHEKASRAYAWSHASGPAGRRKFFVVLGVPPVDSALKAVQASIASGQAT